MTASEFDSLDNERKAQVIIEGGKFLVTIEYYGQRASLYAFEEDFFEVVTDGSTGEVSNVGPVYGVGLDKYINRIELKL